MSTNSFIEEVNLQELKGSIIEMKKKLDTALEDRNIEILERLCFDIKVAIIEHTLAFPEVSTVERYLNKLKDSGNVTYIVSLLHQCWRYANPVSLLENQLDITKTQEQLLDIVLSKYTKKEQKGLDYSSISVQPTREEIRYTSSEMEYVYASRYLSHVHRVLSQVCSKFGLVLDDRFIASRKIDTYLSPKQIEDVFSEILLVGYVDKSDKDNFLSLFSCYPTVPTGKITWLPVNTKNGVTNLALLFTLFDAMAIDMNPDNKELISRYFVKANGESIQPEAIKKRKESVPQQRLRSQIQQALARP